MGALETLAWIGGGYLFWTLTEYWLHRVIFHFEPEDGPGARLHWIMHGVHHDHPNDPMRLVMPPSVSVPLSAVFYLAFYFVLGSTYALAFGAGFFGGYLLYDMTHYHLHHHKPRTRFGKRLRELHMRHHFQDDTRGFGVSAPWWDYVVRHRAPRAPQHPLTRGSGHPLNRDRRCRPRPRSASRAAPAAPRKSELTTIVGPAPRRRLRGWSARASWKITTPPGDDVRRECLPVAAGAFLRVIAVDEQAGRSARTIAPRPPSSARCATAPAGRPDRGSRAPSPAASRARCPSIRTGAHSPRRSRSGEASRRCPSPWRARPPTSPRRSRSRPPSRARAASRSSSAASASQCIGRGRHEPCPEREPADALGVLEALRRGTADRGRGAARAHCDRGPRRPDPAGLTLPGRPLRRPGRAGPGPHARRRRARAGRARAGGHGDPPDRGAHPPDPALPDATRRERARRARSTPSGRTTRTSTSPRTCARSRGRSRAATPSCAA